MLQTLLSVANAHFFTLKMEVYVIFHVKFNIVQLALQIKA